MPSAPPGKSRLRSWRKSSSGRTVSFRNGDEPPGTGSPAALVRGHGRAPATRGRWSTPSLRPSPAGGFRVRGGSGPESERLRFARPMVSNRRKRRIGGGTRRQERASVLPDPRVEIVLNFAGSRQSGSMEKQISTYNINMLCNRRIAWKKAIHKFPAQRQDLALPASGQQQQPERRNHRRPHRAVRFRVPQHTAQPPELLRRQKPLARPLLVAAHRPARIPAGRQSFPGFRQREHSRQNLDRPVGHCRRVTKPVMQRGNLSSSYLVD